MFFVKQVIILMEQIFIFGINKTFTVILFSWPGCYGRFIAPCSKETLQSHASPCTHHISSSLPAYIDLILFPYCFRIVSASGSENDRRTIGERYGINTGLIRERYENGLFRLPSEVIDKKFNLFIIIPFDYILHFNHLPLSAVYAKKASSPFALAQPLYKDNLPFS